MKKRIQIDTTLLVLIILFTGFLYLNRRIYLSPWGVFTSRAHPEERSDEGSQEILPRFARQDEGSNVEKNTPTPQLSCCLNLHSVTSLRGRLHVPAYFRPTCGVPL